MERPPHSYRHFIITVDFGEPAHGWLPVMFRAGTFELALHASNVPANPLESLCEALAVVAAGSRARVAWHLEPAECWFDFENTAGEIALTITEKPGRNRPAAQVFRVTGTSQEVLIPFYRALAQFAARTHSEANWPRLAKDKLAPLGELLKNSH